MVKSLTGKFFFKATSALEVIFFSFSQILFNLACLFAVHHEKSFVPAFFKVSIIVLEESLEKVLNCGSKDLYKPCCYRPRELLFSVQNSFPRYFPARFFPLEISLQDIFF